MQVQKGQLYRHDYIDTLTCVILESTNRGYKVQLVSAKNKAKTSFFDKQDFVGARKYWTLIETK
jgi:hypothetical protein